MKLPIYLDYNATTPLDPEVLDAMLPYLNEVYGNPSSPHGIGRRAKVALEEHREKMAKLWGCKPGEIIFTSSGTEANSLAIIGGALAAKGKGKHVVTTAIEHSSVLKSIRWLEEHLGFYSTIVSTDACGFASPEDIAHALRKDTVLVSVGAANNEVGTIQPLTEIAHVVRDRGILFHTDATQLLGKVPVITIPSLGADLVSCCAHKLFGPKGAGALYVKSTRLLEPVISGGAQEKELRAGTENLAAIVGLVVAMEKNMHPPCFDQYYLTPLSNRFKDAIKCTPGVRFWGPDVSHRLANTLAFSVEGTNSQTLLAALDLAGICVSAGSACTTGALKPSHVLLALGATPEEASSMVRFSLGPTTTLEEIEFTATKFAQVVKQVRN